MAVTEDSMSFSALKERGWTKTLVEQYLGAPDSLAQNPHYASGGKMRLFLKHRVIAVERDETFARTHLVKCRDRAKRLRDSRIEKLLKTNEAIANCKITVRRIALKSLVLKAIKYHNTEFPDLKRPPLYRDDPDDLAEIKSACVQYADDKLSDHHEVAQKIAPYYEGEARRAIARKAYKAISDAYPSLLEECERYVRRFC